MDYVVLAAGLCAIGIALALNYLKGDMLFLKWLKGMKIII
jgi:hypothetical protein